MEFPWRCNVDTIAMDLKVSWEMSVKGVTPIHPSDVPFIVPPIAFIHLIIILESALRPSEIIVYLGNAG